MIFRAYIIALLKCKLKTTLSFFNGNKIVNYKNYKAMVTNENDLADAIMSSESIIELTTDLAKSVDKIISPSDIVFTSVIAALVASTFFWAGPGAAGLGILLGLPAVLAVCGGVGGVVFTVLGASGTMAAYRLLIRAKDIEVIKRLRKYNLENNILTLNH